MKKRRQYHKKRTAIHKKKKRSGYVSWIIFFSLFLLLVSSLFFYLVNRNIMPVLLSVCEAKANQMATEAIDSAVSESLLEEFDYMNLIRIETDQRGEIVLIQPDAMRLSYLRSRSAAIVQNAIEGLKNEEIKIPLASVIGTNIILNEGPDITINVTPIGTVHADIKETFEDAGVNQTRHRIYMEITTMVRIVIPMITSDVIVKTDMPICEYIIVGNIPDAIINLDKNQNNGYLN